MSLVNAGREAAKWKKVVGNGCKHKVMNKYEECSGDLGRSKEHAPDPEGRMNEQFQPVLHEPGTIRGMDCFLPGSSNPGSTCCCLETVLPLGITPFRVKQDTAVKTAFL